MTYYPPPEAYTAPLIPACEGKLQVGKWACPWRRYHNTHNTTGLTQGCSQQPQEFLSISVVPKYISSNDLVPGCYFLEFLWSEDPVTSQHPEQGWILTGTAHIELNEYINNRINNMIYNGSYPFHIYPVSKWWSRRNCQASSAPISLPTYLEKMCVHISPSWLNAIP